MEQQITIKSIVFYDAGTLTDNKILQKANEVLESLGCLIEESGVTKNEDNNPVYTCSAYKPDVAIKIYQDIVGDPDCIYGTETITYYDSYGLVDQEDLRSHFRRGFKDCEISFEDIVMDDAQDLYHEEVENEYCPLW